MSCVNFLIRTKSQPFLIFTYQPVIVIFFFRFLAIPFRKNLRSHSHLRSIGYSHFHFTQAHLPRKILTSGQYVSMLCQEGQVLTVTTNIKRIFRFYYEWSWVQASSQLIRITDRQTLPVCLGPNSRNPLISSKIYPKQKKGYYWETLSRAFFSLSGLRKPAF